ncbi:hypothetical protein LshimejAT787_1002700 [Lyophyllum shimeji]|uniref:Uncharacterized protein n=1 Tax=Lyophyllum shimeji TaxID=47721 RepID=A0A9P3PRZ6_LYOSH|nr:hypothetical protein LshimejAT787_1002700 [Lyophyllum shimeji]
MQCIVCSLLSFCGKLEMLFRDLVTLTSLAVSSVALSQSITRLYIPGFDAQSIVGNIVGITGGSTTWALHDESSRTATLVAGPNFATVAVPVADGTMTSRACSLTLGLALCATSTASEAAIAVETPTFLPVEIAEAQATSLPVPPSSAAVQMPSTASRTSENPAARTSASGATVTFRLHPALPIWSLALVQVFMLL